MAECEPVYEELPGWTEDITGCKSFDELPENARHYLERVSQLTGIPLSIFSVGPDRTQTNIVYKCLEIIIRKTSRSIKLLDVFLMVYNVTLL